MKKLDIAEFNMLLDDITSECFKLRCIGHLVGEQGKCGINPHDIQEVLQGMGLMILECADKILKTKEKIGDMGFN